MEITSSEFDRVVKAILKHGKSWLMMGESEAWSPPSLTMSPDEEIAALRATICGLQGRIRALRGGPPCEQYGTDAWRAKRDREYELLKAATGGTMLYGAMILGAVVTARELEVVLLCLNGSSHAEVARKMRPPCNGKRAAQLEESAREKLEGSARVCLEIIKKLDKATGSRARKAPGARQARRDAWEKARLAAEQKGAK